jgi:hypothetical protein
VLLDEVDKSHPPVNLNHHDLSVGFCWTLNDGALIWYLDGWVMQLVDKTPGGAFAQSEPSFENTSAPTLLSRII